MAMNRWVRGQRKRGLSEEGISSRLGALKVFTNKFVYKHLEATVSDLLGKVERIAPPEKPMPALTAEEQERLLDCYNRYTFEDVRNKALIAVFLASGLRLSEVLSIQMSIYDKVSGEVRVTKRAPSGVR